MSNSGGDKLQVVGDPVALASASKFAANLRAFEINKRQKYEKMTKSTLARLALIEFENSRQENDASEPSKWNREKEDV